MSIISRPDRGTKAGEIYYFLRWMHRSDLFAVNDRTMVQLRNAGGMRLVSNKEVADGMIRYYKSVDFLHFIYEEQTEFRRSLRPHFPRILDGMTYEKFVDDKNFVIRADEPVKLRSEDAETINAVILLLNNIKGINSGLKRRMENLKQEAINLREFIIEKYHLD